MGPKVDTKRRVGSLLERVRVREGRRREKKSTQPDPDEAVRRKKEKG